MTSLPILSHFARFTQALCTGWKRRPPAASRPSLTYWAQHPEHLPPFVQQSPLAMRYVRLLGLLDWEHFPERALQPCGNRVPMPYAPFVAACLIKIDQHLPHLSSLRQFLVDHPALLWVLGFPLTPSDHFPWGFDAERSLPTHRHFTRLLRSIPNATLQCLLDDSVRQLQAELQTRGYTLGECIALDTKHILAWVKENNPKAYVRDRFDKANPPAGDPDCRLGCKRRHNQQAATPEPPTPTANPVPAHSLAVGEFYWGYASGVVATKVPDYGEFVLAELTQPFDQPDVAYFFPLMTATQQRLGFRPRHAALDAAFDAFYVYEYFHTEDGPGFAAVPLAERGGYKRRTFSPDGLPLCEAGLPMPLKYRFLDRSTLVEHERGRYVCPLLFPQPNGETCPIQHARWAKGGCVTTMPTGIGARLRYTLDRDSAEYAQVYKHRTANERINSQAVALGIERPKLRNGQAIANLNTLIYILINLRALQRLRQLPALTPPPEAPPALPA
jgi:hypothetical protein